MAQRTKNMKMKQKLKHVLKMALPDGWYDLSEFDPDNEYDQCSVFATRIVPGLPMGICLELQVEPEGLRMIFSFRSRHVGATSCKPWGVEYWTHEHAPVISWEEWDERFEVAAARARSYSADVHEHFRKSVEEFLNGFFSNRPA